MSQPAINENWVEFYTGAFREQVHQLLAWGYEDARAIISCTHQEEEITGFLCDAMQTRLNDTETPRQYDRYSVHNESPVRGSLQTGKRRQRLDIVLECGGGIKPRPEFMFEAKRLAKNNNPIGDYVGKEGLQCYTSGQYASSYTAAGMIGYIQTDDASYWLGELTRKFDDDSQHEYSIVNSLSQAVVVSSLPNEWSSKHSRHMNDNIEIFHVFLDCC